MKKRIGIVGHFTGENSFGITKAYMRFFSQLGQVILLTPWDEEALDLDLLVLPGGADVDVFRYLEDDDDINLEVQKPNLILERFDRVMLPKYIEKRTPILGICRGHQTLAVYFGGKLIQDMYHETNGDDRTKLVHSVSVNPEGARLIPGFNLGHFEVNSIHHQAVSRRRLPETATILCTYRNKNVKKNDTPETIEALTYFPHYPAHTVQWHPEEMYDEQSCALIYHLLSLTDEERNHEIVILESHEELQA